MCSPTIGVVAVLFLRWITNESSTHLFLINFYGLFLVYLDLF